MVYCTLKMNDPNRQSELLWRSQNVGNTRMDAYRRHVNKRFYQNLRTTPELQRWTVREPQKFWLDLYSYLRLVPALPKGMTKAYDDSKPMSSVPTWYDGIEINYAENAMFDNPDPNAVALVGIREGMDLEKEDGEILTWHQFREQVRLTASALRHSGIKKGDRVGALVATSIWAMVLFHATASIGAIFTSISPELGLEGCVSRLQQVTPKILFADSDTVYKGKTVPIVEKVKRILSRLETQPRTYMIPINTRQEGFPSIDSFLERANPDDALTFTRVPFSYPLLICYSSGTTGAPKCERNYCAKMSPL